MIDKYIGETEKNRTELFDRVKGTNVVLFFDGATLCLASEPKSTPATVRAWTRSLRKSIAPTFQ